MKVVILLIFSCLCFSVQGARNSLFPLEDEEGPMNSELDKLGKKFVDLGRFKRKLEKRRNEEMDRRKAFHFNGQF